MQLGYQIKNKKRVHLSFSQEKLKSIKNQYQCRLHTRILLPVDMDFLGINECSLSAT